VSRRVECGEATTACSEETSLREPQVTEVRLAGQRPERPEIDTAQRRRTRWNTPYRGRRGLEPLPIRHTAGQSHPASAEHQPCQRAHEREHGRRPPCRRRHPVCKCRHDGGCGPCRDRHPPPDRASADFELLLARPFDRDSAQYGGVNGTIEVSRAASVGGSIGPYRPSTSRIAVPYRRVRIAERCPRKSAEREIVPAHKGQAHHRASGKPLIRPFGGLGGRLRNESSGSRCRFLHECLLVVEDQTATGASEAHGAFAPSSVRIRTRAERRQVPD